MMNSWIVERSKVLAKAELASVLADLKRREKRSVNTRMNLAIFRLASCCGLRASEICSLKMRDVHLGIKHPFIQIQKANSKTRKARRIPLWWDLGTMTDIAKWKDERSGHGAAPDDYYVCAQAKNVCGKRLSRINVRNRFISMVRVLGPERQGELTIHSGRHSFVSHALKGRTPQEVRDAAGHASLNTTSIYAHVMVDEQEEAGELFNF